MSDSENEFQNVGRKRKCLTVSSEDVELMRSQVTDVTNPNGRKTYLITYSMVNKNLFPTKQKFAEACEAVFGGGKKVAYYAACEEKHADGSPHYHVCIQLTKSQRWAVPKRKLQEQGATVHFSEGPENADGMYAWAYRYICKSDEAPYETPNHPNLQTIRQNCEKTKAATTAKRKKTEEIPNTPQPEKSKPLTNADIAQYCRDHNIKTVDGFLADAETRKINGDKTFNDYIFSKGPKNLSDTIELAWRMERAAQKITNLKTPRMTALQAALDSPCVEDCNGQWFEAALDLLRLNDINRYVFADALRNLLSKGRHKDRNIFLIGPENTGKTFLLRPLRLVYPETFANPASSRFSWIGADEASIILLNDYRWQTKTNGGNIEWGQLLNLLEGMECKLPQPQNHFQGDLSITSDIPIFATGPEMIRWYANHEEEPRGPRHGKEDRQMACRWKKFELTHQFTNPRDITPCSSCWAKLAFLGSD